MIKWGNKDTPEVWLRWNRRMAQQSPDTPLNKYAVNVETRKCVMQFLDGAEMASEVGALDLSATALTLHIIGASADYEGHSQWDGIFQRMPGLRELNVFMIGFVGKNHKTPNWQEHLAMDNNYLQEDGLSTSRTFGGGSKTLKLTRFQGTYCQFRAQQGSDYNTPDAAVLFNPGLDAYFDAWAPTIAGLIDDATTIIITGYSNDSSHVYNPQVMEVLGATTVVELTQGRFPYVRPCDGSEKSGNVMITKGGTAVRDFIACKKRLNMIDPQEMGQSTYWDQDLGLY